MFDCFYIPSVPKHLVTLSIGYSIPYIPFGNSLKPCTLGWGKPTNAKITVINQYQVVLLYCCKAIGFSIFPRFKLLDVLSLFLYNPGFIFLSYLFPYSVLFGVRQADSRPRIATHVGSLSTCM